MCEDKWRSTIFLWHAMKVLLKHSENYGWPGWEYNTGGKTLAAQAWESDFGPHTCEVHTCNPSAGKVKTGRSLEHDG